MRSRALGGRAALAAALGAILVLAASGANADLAAGRDAFDRGDFDAAEAQWRPLAERGLAEGELGLGEVYEQGKGDYRRAEIWYGKAAQQGNIEARYRLALIFLAGNKDFDPDPVKAYKWAILASDPNEQWGRLAQDLKVQLEARLTADEQRDGQNQADSWRNPKPPEIRAEIKRPIKPAPGIEPGSEIPGLPGPRLPWTDKEITLPPIPGEAPRPPPIISGGSGPSPGRDDLVSMLQGIDCASLRDSTNSQGRTVISGTVPDEKEKEKLIQSSRELNPKNPPDIEVDIVPPPVCRSLSEFDALRKAAFVADGLGLRLLPPLSNRLLVRADNEGFVIREGEPFSIEANGWRHRAYIRLDYFALDGRVKHLYASDLPVDASKPLSWDTSGGAAPFGTELLAVLATPEALKLGRRPAIEDAGAYLQALKTALQASRQRQSNLVATLLVHTCGKAPAACK